MLMGTYNTSILRTSDTNDDDGDSCHHSLNEAEPLNVLLLNILNIISF